MKTKPTPKIETSIVRPAATVTIIINGKSHELSEADARTLHASLGKTLGIEPEKVYIQVPQDYQATDRIPAIPFQPHYIQPPKPYRVPLDFPREITC